jgi:hypothetical protein
MSAGEFALGKRAQGKCTAVLERSDLACLTTIKGMALDRHFHAIRASSWHAS